MNDSMIRSPKTRINTLFIVACVFFYFLIFAQFGFLHRIQESHPPGYLIEMALFAMGFGGILGCIAAACFFSYKHAKSWLMAGFIGCGLAATAVAAIPNIWFAITAALCVGIFLGSLTVSIVPVLSKTFPIKQIGLLTATGVGTAYALANIPFIFNSSAQDHCIMGGAACVIGVVLSNYIPTFGLLPSVERGEKRSTPRNLYWKGGLAAVTAIFLALIWLDSAVFFIIQETESLKANTWSAPGQLWAIAGIHFAAAILGGKILDKGWFFPLMLFSLGLLILGSWSISHPIGNASSWPIYLYVTAVSFYSTGLVSYAALRPEMKQSPKIQTRAAWVFGIAGWVGSGMGIGMAKDLHTIPNLFFLVVVLLALADVIFLRFSKSDRRLQPLQA